MSEHSDTQRSLGQLEGRMVAVEGGVFRVESKIDTLGSQMAEVLAFVNQTKGGKRAMIAVSGVVGAIVSGLVTWFTSKPH